MSLCLKGCYSTEQNVHSSFSLPGSSEHAYQPVANTLMPPGSVAVPRKAAGDVRAYERVETEPGLDKFVNDAEGVLLYPVMCVCKPAHGLSRLLWWMLLACPWSPHAQLA